MKQNTSEWFINLVFLNLKLILLTILIFLGISIIYMIKIPVKYQSNYFLEIGHINYYENKIYYQPTSDLIFKLNTENFYKSSNELMTCKEIIDEGENKNFKKLIKTKIPEDGTPNIVEVIVTAKRSQDAERCAKEIYASILKDEVENIDEFIKKITKEVINRQIKLMHTDALTKPKYIQEVEIESLKINKKSKYEKAKILTGIYTHELKENLKTRSLKIFASGIAGLFFGLLLALIKNYNYEEL